MNIQTALEHALRSTGRISPKDRIEIVEKGDSNYSDYVRVGLNVYHSRKKRPFAYWNICVDMARELIRWDASTFYHL